MSHPTNVVDLLVPGLFGPMKSLQDLESTSTLAAMERLLSRADLHTSEGRGLAGTLAGMLYEAGQQTDFPVAALNRIGEGGAADDGYWLQLHPVYLRPDQGRLLLFDSDDLDLSLAEARALADQFQAHFSDHDWQVEVHSPGCWYLGMREDPGITTTDIETVFGRSIERFLPRGDKALQWHAWLNEVQMLFHGSTVNQQREGEGKLPISGLWVSGGGVLGSFEKTSYQGVMSDAALGRGLASVLDLPHLRLDAERMASPGRQLVIYDRLQRPVMRADPYDWYEAMITFIQWLQPLVDTLGAPGLSALHIHPCNGSRYSLSRKGLRRFWRRQRPIHHFLDQE